MTKDEAQRSRWTFYEAVKVADCAAPDFFCGPKGTYSLTPNRDRPSLSTPRAYFSS